MSEFATFIAFVVAQAIAVFLVVKLLPGAITKYVNKEIERRSDIKLEKVKGEIQGSYSALKSSVDMVTASNSGLHPHIIETVTTMWGLIVAMKQNCSGMLTFDSVLLADEAAVAFKNQHKHANVIALVDKHRNESDNFADNDAALEPSLEKHRLFCGDRLWLRFFIIRALYLRASILISRSFQVSEFDDWRKDDGIRQLLSAVLPKEFVEGVRARKMGGLQAAIDQLEAEFLHEATRVMSGSKAMSDSLADVQSVVQLEYAKAAQREK